MPVSALASRKRPFAVVEVQPVPLGAGDEEVEPAVAVPVASGRPVPGEAGVRRLAVGRQVRLEAGGDRDLGEEVDVRDLRVELRDLEGGELPDAARGLAHAGLGGGPRPLAPALRVAAPDEEGHVRGAGRARRRGGLGGARHRARVVVEGGALHLEAHVLDLGEVVEEGGERREELGPRRRPGRGVAPGPGRPVVEGDPLDLRLRLAGHGRERRREDGVREELARPREVAVAHREREREDVVGERLGEVLGRLQPRRLALGRDGRLGGAGGSARAVSPAAGAPRTIAAATAMALERASKDET